MRYNIYSEDPSLVFYVGMVISRHPELSELPVGSIGGYVYPERNVSVHYKRNKKSITIYVEGE